MAVLRHSEAAVDNALHAVRYIAGPAPGGEVLYHGRVLNEEVARLRDALRGAVGALEKIERLRAKWDAPDSGGDQVWAAVGSEAHKIAAEYLRGGQSETALGTDDNQPTEGNDV